MFDTPQRIADIAAFGVGTFTDEELADKCAEIRALREGRGKVDVPHVSVVVPAYQEQGYILATLRSLAEQTAADCECVIVSNGEPYGNLTQQIAEQSGFKVVHEPGKGIALARQVGLENAVGDIVVTTDADTIHGEMWLQAISDFLEQHEEVVAGSGFVHLISDRSLYRGWQEWDNFARRLNGACLESNSFFRRDAASQTTGYDTSLIAAENSSLFRQLKKYGKMKLLKSEEGSVYTSDRRMQKDGLFGHIYRQLKLGVSDASQGKLKMKEYPDVR